MLKSYCEVNYLWSEPKIRKITRNHCQKFFNHKVYWKAIKNYKEQFKLPKLVTLSTWPNFLHSCCWRQYRINLRHSNRIPLHSDWLKIEFRDNTKDVGRIEFYVLVCYVTHSMGKSAKIWNRRLPTVQPSPAYHVWRNYFQS